MRDESGWKPKRIAWLGPQKISDNGLELRAIVVEDNRGYFHAGTRYGPKGIAMPEFGPGEFWHTVTFKDRNKAIEAAKKDAQWTLNGCNAKARAERLLDKATTPGGGAGKVRWAVRRTRGIDR